MNEGRAPEPGAPRRTDLLSIVVATGLGSGYAPIAPGTAGSAVGLLLFWPLHTQPAVIQVAAVAILFLVFDIETAFLYPWALKYRELSCTGPLGTDGLCGAGISFFGLAEILVFMAVLIVGLAYVWRKRAIGWE